METHKLAVLGDVVVSWRPLDAPEQRELRAAGRRRIARGWAFLALPAVIALAMVTRIPGVLVVSIPFLVLLPGAVLFIADGLRLFADARAGHVFVFASGSGRSERLARSGRAWTAGQEPAAWRSM